MQWQIGTIKSIERRVIDYGNILSPIERDSLFQAIDDIRVSIGPHLAVVITDSLNGITIDKFAYDTFEQIRLGRMAYKDGLLIAVSMKESLIRIETGEGIIAAISDEDAKYINITIISPKFEEHKYFDGLLAAIFFIRNKLEQNRVYFNRYSKS
jgi:uncharacterized membrane protein YgcG